MPCGSRVVGVLRDALTLCPAGSDSKASRESVVPAQGFSQEPSRLAVHSIEELRLISHAACESEQARLVRMVHSLMQRTL